MQLQYTTLLPGSMIDPGRLESILNVIFDGHYVVQVRKEKGFWYMELTP
jgi:hypothetical protein